MNERREHPRFKVNVPVEIHAEGATAPLHCATSDLSLGGCYVEMAIPIKVGTKVTVSIWIGQAKAAAEAEVAHFTPGFGVGIRFTKISNQDLGIIGQYLNSLAPLARKPLLGNMPRTAN